MSATIMINGDDIKTQDKDREGFMCVAIVFSIPTFKRLSVGMKLHLKVRKPPCSV